MRAETGTFEDRSAAIVPPVVPSSPWSIVALGVLPEWRMKVRFLDGHEGIINMRELVFSPNAGVFASLIDVGLFEQAYLEYGAVTWPNGLDIAPDAAHDEIEKDGVWVINP